MEEDQSDQNSINFFNQVESGNQTGQNFQSQPIINKRPRRNWTIILLASLFIFLLDGGISSILYLFLVKGSIKISAFNDSGGLGLYFFGSLIIFLFDIIFMIISSAIGARILVKKQKVDSSFGNTFATIVLFLIIISSVFLIVSKIIPSIPTKFGYDKPVSEWKKFENNDFSFSYPKDTQLVDKTESSAVHLVSVFAKGESLEGSGKKYLSLEISIVNPDLYEDISQPDNTISKAKLYAEKVYQANQATKDYHSPDYGRAAQKVVESNFFGSQAYVLTIIGYYQGPGNGYKMDFGGDGEYAYYYVDSGDKIYQIRVPVRDEYGQRILKTLKFTSAQVAGMEEKNILTSSGYINCIGLDLPVVSDVNLYMSASQNFIRLTQKKELIDDYGDDYYAASEDKKIGYRITEDTKFYINGAETGQSKITELNKDVTGIEKCTGGLKNTYKNAMVEYRRLQCDDLEKNDYFVATKIYFK